MLKSRASEDSTKPSIFLNTSFLILISSFMFKFNEIAGIWAITITVFLVNLMGLINFGGVFVTAILGVAIILTWIMEK